MKIQFMSDLHLEFYGLEVTPAPDVDVMVFAGDIGVCDRGLQWIKKIPFSGPKIYVPGNHEYYNSSIENVDQIIDQEKGDVIVLKPSLSVEIGGYTFIGSTYWTNMTYRSLGRIITQESVKMIVQECMNDYRYINYKGCVLTADDTIMFNQNSRTLMMDQIRSNQDKNFVVVTHHAPSIRSSLPRYINDPSTAGYVNTDEDMITETPNIKLWIHGHVHNSNEYRIGNCLVASNPRGYASAYRTENKMFDPNIVIDLGAQDAKGFW